MTLRSPLGRVRGLGSAKDGVHHWWAQRLTALALVPLTIWFVVSLICMVGADRIEVVAWLSSPFQAALMICLVIATFHHAQLGLQVVIEDYVHHEGAKVAAIALVKGAAFLIGLVGVLAVLKIAFGG